MATEVGRDLWWSLCPWIGSWIWVSYILSDYNQGANLYEPETVLQDLQNCKWKENLALIFQLFLLTRITSQSELQQQCCTLEFKANPVWALSSILLFLFERKRGGGKGKDAVTTFTRFQLGDFFEAIFEAQYKKLQKFSVKSFPPHVTQVHKWPGSQVAVPYWRTRAAWPQMLHMAVEEVLLPVGPHKPCMALPCAGTWGAVGQLASAKRGWGHSSRTPPGTSVPWFWYVHSLAGSSNCALAELRGLAGGQIGTYKWEQTDWSESWSV